MSALEPRAVRETVAWHQVLHGSSGVKNLSLAARPACCLPFLGPQSGRRLLEKEKLVLKASASPFSPAIDRSLPCLKSKPTIALLDKVDHSPVAIQAPTPGLQTASLPGIPVILAHPSSPPCKICEPISSQPACAMQGASASQDSTRQPFQPVLNVLVEANSSLVPVQASNPTDDTSSFPTLVGPDGLVPMLGSFPTSDGPDLALPDSRIDLASSWAGKKSDELGLIAADLQFSPVSVALFPSFEAPEGRHVGRRLLQPSLPRWLRRLPAQLS